MMQSREYIHLRGFLRSRRWAAVLLVISAVVRVLGGLIGENRVRNGVSGLCRGSYSYPCIEISCLLFEVCFRELGNAFIR